MIWRRNRDGVVEFSISSSIELGLDAVSDVLLNLDSLIAWIGETERSGSLMKSDEVWYAVWYGSIYGPGTIWEIVTFWSLCFGDEPIRELQAMVFGFAFPKTK